MSDLLAIGMRSLMAYQSAMTVVSQNLANIDTPYYSRRVVDFSDALFGSGVNIADVRRVYDQTTSQYVQQSKSSYEMYDIYWQRMLQFESLLDDPGNNLVTYINDSLSTLRILNNNPGDAGNRSLYLTRLTNLSNQFNNLSGQIATSQQNVNQSLQTNVSVVNQLLGQIGAYNNQLINALPNTDQSDLLDQREQTVQELAKYINFKSLTDSQGQLNIYIDNGLSLVQGQNVYTLSAQPNPSNSNEISIFVNESGSSTDITNSIQGGQIAGLLNFYNEGLAAANRSLGRLALAMSDAFNSQNKSGIDLNGNYGGNIFTDINATAAMENRVLANFNNTGDASLNVHIDDITKLTTSDYTLSIDASNNYVLTRTDDNTVVSTGAVGSLPQTISVDGFSININGGNLQAGDQFVISPTMNAAADMNMILSDPAKLALASPVSAVANTSNQGGGAIKLTGITDMSNSSFSIPNQLNPPLKIQFLTSTTYQIINANNGTSIEGPITYDPTAGANIFPTPGGYDPGYTISLTGEINAGDTFNISFNTNSSGDNTNGLLMAKLYEKNILENGTYTFVAAYDEATNDISVKTNSAESGYNATLAILDSAETQFNDVSGVDMEEESINLIKYQQAYLASAQVIEVAKSVLDVIIGLARR